MQFNYNEYQEVVNRAQSSNNNAPKIGWVRLKDGEEALVRLAVTTVDDLIFNSVHKPVFGKKFEGCGTGLTPISCLNPLGGNVDNCPFCKAVSEGHDTVGKAVKSVYIKLYIAYKDPTTGNYAESIPAIWERPAGYSRELANKIKDYGDLKQTIFKLSRTGSGTDTKYSLDYIPIFNNKQELVSSDFSVFDNFDISRHSYWKKTAEEMLTFLATGKFASTEVAQKDQEQSVSAAPAPQIQPEAYESSAKAYENPGPLDPVFIPNINTQVQTPASNYSGFAF